MERIDVAIIGCGPAGLQAAIHSSRKKVSTVVFGKSKSSSISGAHLENYVGLPGKTDGSVFLENGLSQAKSFGAVFVAENVIAASQQDGGFLLSLESGAEYLCRAVVIATGNTRVKLGVPGEKEFLGKGVSYCASCDCNFYKGKTVAVVGCESEAAVSAELMNSYASKVYWVCDAIEASPELVKKAVAAGTEIVESKVKAIKGAEKVTGLELENGKTLDLDGVFIELGAKSAADIAMDLGVMPNLDDSIPIDQGCMAAPGVYACGDVTGRPWQVAKAVGQGCVAGSGAADYVKGKGDVVQ